MSSLPCVFVHVIILKKESLSALSYSFLRTYRRVYYNMNFCEGITVQMYCISMGYPVCDEGRHNILKTLPNQNTCIYSKKLRNEKTGKIIYSFQNFNNRYRQTKLLKNSVFSFSVATVRKGASLWQF